MSYKQILTTNDIGAGANQVATGNHNHDSTYVKKINFLDNGTDLNNVLDKIGDEYFNTNIILIQ